MRSLAATANLHPPPVGVSVLLNRLANVCSPDPRQPVALAVSGGSDSMALFWHLSKWAKQSGRSLHVFSVDHGLRPEAARECAFVASQCREAGHEFTLLTWKKSQPGQAAARRARHRLLAEGARLSGARMLCLGHTLDDVIETLLMRRRRAVRTAYQAGPAIASASPVWPEGRGLALVRPLLFSRRSDLRTELRHAARGWIEDPSNVSLLYERVRLRQKLDRHSGWHGRLGQIAKRALARRHSAAAALGTLLLDQERVVIEPDGLIRFCGSGLDDSQLCEALGFLIRVASGGDRSPRAHAVGRAFTLLAHSGDRVTLGGAWLQKARSGLLIGRDPGEGRQSVAHGLWDGRYIQDETKVGPGGFTPLMRDSAPPGLGWREIMSDRLRHEAVLMRLCAEVA